MPLSTPHSFTLLHAHPQLSSLTPSPLLTLLKRLSSFVCVHHKCICQSPASATLCIVNTPLQRLEDQACNEQQHVASFRSPLQPPPPTTIIFRIIFFFARDLCHSIQTEALLARCWVPSTDLFFSLLVPFPQTSPSLSYTLSTLTQTSLPLSSLFHVFSFMW